MPKMPTPEQRKMMHELAHKTLDPREILEGLLNDDPELAPLRDRLIADGLVQVVDDDGNPVG